MYLTTVNHTWCRLKAPCNNRSSYCGNLYQAELSRFSWQLFSPYKLMCKRTRLKFFTKLNRTIPNMLMTFRLQCFWKGDVWFSWMWSKTRKQPTKHFLSNLELHNRSKGSSGIPTWCPPEQNPMSTDTCLFGLRGMSWSRSNSFCKSKYWKY